MSSAEEQPAVATAAETIESVAAALDGAEKLLITCHRGPDGDAVGSMVALAALLRARGKAATLYSPDLIPRHLKWLPHLETLVHRLNPASRYQLTVVLDCGDEKLLGGSLPGCEITGARVVLDHHASVRPFGEHYFCDPTAASVGVLIYRIARCLGWTIGADAALGLYVSVASDTGWFRYANTNAEAFAMAAELVAGGLDPWQVTEQMNERTPLSRLRLLSGVLAELTLFAQNRGSLMVITAEMLKRCGASWDDSEGLINYGRAIDGVEVAVLLTPAKGGAGTRVSMRCKGHLIDVGAICSTLGGGGHRGAAGAIVPAPIDAARTIVCDLVEAALATATASTDSGATT